MPEVSEVIGHLQRNYRPEQHIAYAIWCEEDVMRRALKRKLSITKEQAESILDRMYAKHDAELGITWDTIDCALDELEE